MFFILSRAWDKEKNSESPWGIEPQTFGFRAPMLYYWATSVMFVDIIRKMVSSELGKEIVKYISHLVTMVVSFGTRNFFFVSRSWQDEKCLSLQLFTSLSRASFNLNVYYFYRFLVCTFFRGPPENHLDETHGINRYSVDKSLFGG